MRQPPTRGGPPSQGHGRPNGQGRTDGRPWQLGKGQRGRKGGGGGDGWVDMGSYKSQVCSGASYGMFVHSFACFLGAGLYICSVGVYVSSLKHLVHSSHSMLTDTDSATGLHVRVLPPATHIAV